MADDLTHKQQAFLAAFEKLGTIAGAAQAAQITRKTHYDWMDKDAEGVAKNPKYVSAFEDAYEASGEWLITTARQKAMVGVDEPVYYKGKVVGQVKKQSDAIHIYLLKMHYGAADIQATLQAGVGGAPLQLEMVREIYREVYRVRNGKELQTVGSGTTVDKGDGDKPVESEET